MEMDPETVRAASMAWLGSADEIGNLDFAALGAVVGPSSRTVSALTQLQGVADQATGVLRNRMNVMSEAMAGAATTTEEADRGYADGFGQVYHI